ncbi:MAG: DUF2249 domain-containing protein [Herbaspirillum sp.]
MAEDLILDVCGLEPPEPLELVLEAISALPKTQRLKMIIDREPRPLYPILTNNGFQYSVSTDANYRYEILIWHRA